MKGFFEGSRFAKEQDLEHEVRLIGTERTVWRKE